MERGRAGYVAAAVGGAAVLAYVSYRLGARRQCIPQPHELKILKPLPIAIKPTKHPRDFVIVGGGPGGALLACYLSRMGHNVTVLERDSRDSIMTCLDKKQPSSSQKKQQASDGGKATGVTLYPRGKRALMAVLTEEECDGITVPLIGREIHVLGPDKTPIHQTMSVGRFEKHMYTVNRTGCQALCLQVAEQSGAKVLYGANVSKVDIEAASVEYKRADRPEVTCTITGDCVVGADGAFSMVREAFMRQRIYCVEKFQVDGFTHGWKRVRLHNVLAPSPPEPDQKKKAEGLRPDCMHIWPFPDPGNGVAICCVQDGAPGLDCALVMPKGETHGPWHFEGLKTEEKVRAFFDEILPEMVALDETVVEQFLANPVGNFCSAAIAPYHYKDRMLMLGDCAHAMAGFWGQGMNSALEDAMVFARLLMEREEEAAGEMTTESYVDVNKKFSDVRCKSGHAIVQMSMAHMKWFTDSISSALWQYRQKYQEFMHGLLPSLYYPPLHHIVHFYDLSYHDMHLIEDAHRNSWSIGAL